MFSTFFLFGQCSASLFSHAKVVGAFNSLAWATGCCIPLAWAMEGLSKLEQPSKNRSRRIRKPKLMVCVGPKKTLLAIKKIRLIVYKEQLYLVDQKQKPKKKEQLYHAPINK